MNMISFLLVLLIVCLLSILHCFFSFIFDDTAWFLFKHENVEVEEEKPKIYYEPVKYGYSLICINHFYDEMRELNDDGFYSTRKKCKYCKLEKR